MKQQSAISSRLSATTANASCRATARVRKLRSLLAISTVLALSTAADKSSDARYNDLGQRTMCACDSEPAAMGPSGCHQVLLRCNHLNCDTSDRMRELRAALEKGDNDVILHSFVQKYGASVLVMASMSDISTLAWIVAFAVLAATASIVIAFARKGPVAPGNGDNTALQVARHRRGCAAPPCPGGDGKR